MSLHIPDLKFCFFYCLVNIYISVWGASRPSICPKKTPQVQIDREQATADLAGALLGRQSRQTPLPIASTLCGTSAESSVATG
jgi:hypothetical protein